MLWCGVLCFSSTYMSLGEEATSSPGSGRTDFKSAFTILQMTMEYLTNLAWIPHSRLPYMSSFCEKCAFGVWQLNFVGRRRIVIENLLFQFRKKNIVGDFTERGKWRTSKFEDFCKRWKVTNLLVERSLVLFNEGQHIHPSLLLPQRGHHYSIKILQRDSIKNYKFTHLLWKSWYCASEYIIHYIHHDKVTPPQLHFFRKSSRHTNIATKTSNSHGPMLGSSKIAITPIPA